MESAPPPSRRFRWCLLAALAGYAVFLAVHYAPVAAGADASGYMHSARLFASGRLTTPMRTMPELTVNEPIHTTPLGFQAHRDPGRLEPTYPSGLPLHIALASLVFGMKWGTLVVGVGGAVTAVALCYLLAPFAPWRERGCDLAALWLWFAVLTLFYAFYDQSQQAWWYLRFILPGFPALVILAMLGLEHGIRRRAGGRRATVTTLCAILVALTPAAVFARWERELHVMLLPSYQRLYLEAPAWVRAHCPPDSVIATLTLSGTFYYYTDFPVLRWDQMGTDDFARYAAALRTSGRPLYAAVLDDEIQPVFTEWMPGHWEKLVKIDLCTLWRYRPEP